ncbi:histone-lysine N-methyltransferase SETD5 isoform X3 [Synchiropus splendidus]|uniref:histone-lysine N-methyltransferase SETD5 isoform X3 n=1 Tax=Synchiropus splendidus TaxID=270530 RepID=UPI00237EB8F4|nr:histone-lysine N-methyltransferase SETD5 isoform X3 [Synchiropus splendidus]
MSIVIALGVTTPETSYSDMAAGSDPESVEASPAVSEKNYTNQSCGSAQNHGYQGLPYADHNYGAPPPPTPPASPLSQTIIPCMDLSGVVRSTRYHETTGDNSADTDSSSSDEHRGLSNWCHCSLTPDGLLIKCDKCRGLNRRKQIDDFRRKTENVSAGESSATESGDDEVSPPTISYTATQHTPTSIKLTVNRVKRSKSKKRKKNTEKVPASTKGKKVKAFREGSRKSMRMKSSTTEANVLDESTAEGWEGRIRQWTDQYEEAMSNQYSADLQTLLQLHLTTSATLAKPENRTVLPTIGNLQASFVSMETIDHAELSCNNTVLGSQMQLQLGRVTRVQKHRKILRAAKNLDPDALIIEYRGKVMLKQQFEANGHFFKKPFPFVLFYSKFSNVEMCVDARTFGNDARFIRRSCTPNAEVRHAIIEGMIHLCICAVTHIPKDAEVTIGFDFEFNSCNYKVDCACHKGNQTCPVQKHNIAPHEGLQNSILPLPSPHIGAETRRRKAWRKELQGCIDGEDKSATDQPQELKDPQKNSDAEQRLVDGLKEEEAEGDEVDGNCETDTCKKTLNALERRRRRMVGTYAKDETVELPGEVANLSGNPHHSAGVGISTRRTTYVMDTPVVKEKTPLTTLPVPVATPKPTRSSKPRPKSRISRYRSSSSQRARRQRQALAQQAAAMTLPLTSVHQGPSHEEEGTQGPYGVEVGLGESLGQDHPTDDGLGCLYKGNLRYPKTKKYLVTEWLNEKLPGGEKLSQEVPVERPLRITTDPTVLATTLNMLPGLSHSSFICTTPRHYVRFGSPFNPERCRPRPLQMDGTYGCFKKRWIKQVESESGLTSCSESTSSLQSISSRSNPNTWSSTDLNAPFKKRTAKYMTETTPAPTERLQCSLSPITPPPTEDTLIPKLQHTCGSLLLNGLVFSPIPSRPASSCNTPLQFENISSPETSPTHQLESISSEPCLQTDLDIPRPQFSEVSVSSSLASPLAMTSDDLSFPEGPSGYDSKNMSSSGFSSLYQVSCPTTDLNIQSRELAFRTEFNLIYTCSPLNANMDAPLASVRQPSHLKECLSPPESFPSSLNYKVLPGSQSDLLYGSNPESGTTSPYTGNPTQRKKKSHQHTIGLLTGKPGYEAIAVSSEYQTVQNMVSLLEYRKRKQVSSHDSQAASCSPPGGGPHNHRGTLDTPHHSHHQLHRSLSAHSSSLPEMEKGADPQCRNLWMVPTSVERLREEPRPMEHKLKDTKAPAEKDIDAECSETQAAFVTSAMRSPLLLAADNQAQSEQPSSHQQDSHSPFRGRFSPPSEQGCYPSFTDSHPAAAQHHKAASSSEGAAASGSVPQQSDTNKTRASKSQATQCNSSRRAENPNSSAQTSHNVDLNRQMSGTVPPQAAGSPGHGVLPPLQAGPRLLPAPGAATHPQLVQFQHPNILKGSGVRTQSGSF